VHRPVAGSMLLLLLLLLDDALLVDIMGFE